MGLGDALNNLATGYQRGQAQYAANEEARQKAAAAAAKAAQEAAEFRLKLATHSQALTNSAEDEYNSIMAEVTSDNWDPAKLPALMPRVANFDKTYGSVWGGGSATEALQKALHLDSEKLKIPAGIMGGEAEVETQDPLFGFMSQDQKDAADEKAIASRSAAAGRQIFAMASEYISNPDGGLVDEVEAYTRLHQLQAEVMSGKRGQFDPKVIDDAFDQVRESIGKAYAGVASQMGLGKQMRDQVEEIGRNASTWITSILQMDANGAMIGEDLFASRTPLRLKMEQYAQSMAEQGMPLGQIKARIANKFSDEVGGLELDIRKTPGMGALTFAGAPKEARNAVDRYFDLNISPNEARLETFWNPQTGEAWVVDPVNPQASERVWPPANQGAIPQGVASGGQPTAPAADQTTAPAQAPKAAKPPKPEKPKEPEIPIEELMARDPKSLTGPETARVMQNMTGSDFIRWMMGSRK